MAKKVIKNAGLSLDTGSVVLGSPRVLSTLVKSCTVTYSCEVVDVTTMGDTTGKTKKGGLLDWSIDAQVALDDTADGMLQDLYDLMSAAENFDILMGHEGLTAGGTTPVYDGECVLESITPIAGSVGEQAMVAISLQGSGPLNWDDTP